MKLALLVVTLFTTLLALAASATNPNPSPSPVSVLAVSMPAAVRAGDTVRVDVTTDPGAAITVLVSGSYRTTTLELQATTATTRIAVPFTDHTGSLEVVAFAGDRTASASTYVEPGPMVAPPEPLVGARSIVADGEDRAMVVAIPSDQFGNPVRSPEGTEIEVTHPDGSVAVVVARATHTLEWAWVRSITTAGVAGVSIEGQAPGMVRSLIEIPGAPVPFGLVAETAWRPADGATLVSVASDVLVDAYGNRLLDGTAAVVRSAYPDGTMSIQTVVTVGGVARGLLEAPTAAGVVTVSMTVQGTPSRPIDVVFENAPMVATASPQPTKVVTVGPPSRRGAGVGS
jgi:hypothetical protein